MTTDQDEALERLEAAAHEASKDPRRIDANRVKELTLAGKSLKDIAEHLGCAPSAVSRARARMGINKPRNSHRKVNLDQLRELHDRGLSRKELAEHFACTPERVTAARRQLGIAPQKHGSGRYKVIDREEVRARTEQGETLQQIADALGCSVRGVANVRAELGITGTERLRITPERITRIQQMLDDGWSFAEITRTDGASYDTLKRHFPDRQWTLEQRLEYLSTLRRGHGYNWGSQRHEKSGRAA